MAFQPGVRELLKRRGMDDDELDEYDRLQTEREALRASDPDAKLPEPKEARLNALFRKFADSGKHGAARRIC